MKEFKHFDLSEREKIEKFLRKGKSLRFVARALDRSVSSISDEIKNNNVKGGYTGKKANHKAYVKRETSKRDCLKVAMDVNLKKFVIENIKDDQSPEGISGRLKHIEKGIKYASGKAICKFIASPHGRQIESHLFSKAVRALSIIAHQTGICKFLRTGKKTCSPCLLARRANYRFGFQKIRKSSLVRGVGLEPTTFPV